MAVVREVMPVSEAVATVRRTLDWVVYADDGAVRFRGPYQRMVSELVLPRFRDNPSKPSPVSAVPYESLSAGETLPRLLFTPRGAEIVYGQEVGDDETFYTDATTIVRGY